MTIASNPIAPWLDPYPSDLLVSTCHFAYQLPVIATARLSYDALAPIMIYTAATQQSIAPELLMNKQK